MNLMARTRVGAAIHEARPWYIKHEERDLVNWWINQAKEQSNLICVGGERLLVIDSGIMNDGPGPDILNAHLMLDDVEISGSVEMHLTSRGWYEHGHDADSSYEDVILHVVINDEGGPDIPTLVVPSNKFSNTICLACRPARKEEVEGLGIERFYSKMDHINQLDNPRNLHPLLLGMMEVLLAGPRRNNQLQELATMLDLPCWPHLRPWQGSHKSYRQNSGQALQQINQLISMQRIIQEIGRRASLMVNWADLNQAFELVQSAGITQNQFREWISNILAPYLGFEAGLRIWQTLPPFRKYGHEKRYLSQIGLQKIETILIQQGIIEWGNRYCKPHRCTACPLLHSHHDLTLIN